MDPITEGELQSTSTTPLASNSPAISSINFLKTPASPGPGSRPRPAMPAGPRIRKTTGNAISIHTLANGSSNGRRISSESAAAFTSGRTSPALSNQSAQSPTSERRYTAPPPPMMEDKEIQTDVIEIPTPPPRPSPTPEPTRASTPAYKVVSKPVTLPFPTPINFTAPQITYRGLPLEAAQWTFTSDQLRDIVSRAIRDSAKESFIRLLPSDALEKDIPTETERLETLRFSTQAQHRFHFQRRTNLLQGMNALASTIPLPDDGGTHPISSMTAQLAEISTAMDRFAETLLHASDQRAQLSHVQDVHVSSALAMALRKLNASYSKRTADLKLARTRIEALEAELEEAWKVAEDMAEEIDDLDHFGGEYGLGDELEDSEGALPESEENGGDLMGDDEDFTVKSVSHAEVVGATKAVLRKATLVSSPMAASPTEFFPPTTKRDRARSIASRTSSTDRDRSSKVSAARKRSIRTSKASLRIPKVVTDAAVTSPTHKRTRSRSKSVVRQPSGDTPNVPPIPNGLESANGMNSSFLELSRPGTPQASDEEIPPVPELLYVSKPATEEGGSGASSSKAAENVLDDEVGVTLKVPDKDSTSPYSAGFDRSFIPALAVNTESSQLLRATSLIVPLESPNSHSVKPRRIQSMQPSGGSSLLSTSSSQGEHRLAYLDEDEEDGISSPSSTRITVTQDDQQIVSPVKRSGYDKFDPWPWSTKKKPSPPSRPVPQPPPSPTPSFVPAIPPHLSDKPKNAASSIFKFKSRRNSMPSASGAIAALLPWTVPSRPSSEPDLPSASTRNGPMSPLSTASS